MNNPYREEEAPVMDMGSILAKRKPSHRQKRKGIHSQLHEDVAMLRDDFKETAVKGKGSFGFYLRLLKPVPSSLIHMWFADIQDSPKLDTPLARAKVFWHKYKTWKTPHGKKVSATLYTAQKSVQK